ncbi:MAG: type II secretion system F family protein [archaeon]|nr:type II secretion system F family protein [archaeon]MCR4323698.1 type II secretion system F family protein [Nanoarchaeota archaeon]
MKFEKKHYLGIGFALIVATLAVIFFSEGPLFYFLLVISLILATLPIVISLVASQGEQKDKEEMFLAFARDLVETVKSGAPINKSIMNLQTRDYGPLSPHIRKLANQLSIGINLNVAFFTFAKETKSTAIARAVGLISEAERAGGKIETILESVAKSVNQIENLKKERKSAVSNLVTQGYIIFLVFIVIMLVLEFKILPLVSDLSGAEGLTLSVKSLDPDSFSMPLFVMLLVQSLFAGLVIGKISEGSIKNGIKHSFILLVTTLLITTGVRALLGG